MRRGNQVRLSQGSRTFTTYYTLSTVYSLACVFLDLRSTERHDIKLATVHRPDGAPTTAVAIGEEIVYLSLAAPELPGEMSQVLAAGPVALKRILRAAQSGEGRSALDPGALAAPVQRPGKFVAVELSYVDDVAESGVPTPDYPTVFATASSCVNGPYGDVLRPAISDELDYEGELGFVIGKRCRHVPREREREVIAGFLVVNDFTVRDIQHRTSQRTLGKSFDTHGVIGPWIVTTSPSRHAVHRAGGGWRGQGRGAGDPHALPLRTLVNGEVRRSSNTSKLIFGCFRTGGYHLQRLHAQARGHHRRPARPVVSARRSARCSSRTTSSASRLTASARSRTAWCRGR